MGRESLVILRTKTSVDAEVPYTNKGGMASMEAGEQQNKKGLKRRNNSSHQQEAHAEDQDERTVKNNFTRKGELVELSEQASLIEPTTTAENGPTNSSKQANSSGISSKDGDDGGAQHQESDREQPSSHHPPLHRTDSEHETLEMEAALRFHHNRRVLLARLEDTLPNGRLYMINLSRRNLGPAESRLIAAAVQANPQLSILKLCYNSLGDDGAVVVANALRTSPGRHHASLTTLDLGFNDIGDTGCRALAIACVASNYTLESLYLTGNRIEENGALSIARAFLQGTGITSLYLSANNIGSTGMAAIALAVAKNDERLASPEACAISAEAPTRRVQHLHVSATLTDQEGFEAVAGLVLTTATLKTLCLSGNNIDDHDMVLLSHALAQNKSIPLESIRLGYNQITCQGVECFMNAVWGSASLREVMLNHNKLQDRGAQLCAVVLTSINLQILDVSFNRVTTVGIKALMKNLSENTSLSSLSLCGIPIDLNASKAVSYALAYNNSLRELYLDNCSTGYSSQRHIVAGVVSNRRSSLSVLTGFAVGPVAMTLGMPQLPAHWTNAQVLGFFQEMWSQWLLKSGRGVAPTNEEAVRGPAPPAAVAAAAKIALAGVGSSEITLIRSQHDPLMTERPPIDAARTALIERTESGSVAIPEFANDLNGDVDEWLDRKWQTDLHTEQSSSGATARCLLENAERRDRNLMWLRGHFRSLNEVGRLPFNNADLWQLHQYYFSPPFAAQPDGDLDIVDAAEAHVSDMDALKESCSTFGHTGSLDMPKNVSLGRSVSFQTLGNAFAGAGLVPNSHKRRSQVDSENVDCPAAKRAKGLSKPRIGYYPRIMAKIQSLGTKPMEQSLTLLRQLRYVENLLFSGTDPYLDNDSTCLNGHDHTDVEMILLDLL